MKEEVLLKPEIKPSLSVNTSQFRKDYDTLLKEVLEESSDDDEDLLDGIDIDMDTATADLPEDLRTALEDRSLADKYLANLKTFMSHRRSQSVNSLTGKGDFSLPNTPTQKSFQLLSAQVTERADPLSKVLDAIPYQNRLISGVPSLTLLEQRFCTLIIPELELPTWPESDILDNLEELNKLRDDLSIHFSGGLLTNNMIGEKKKNSVFLLLDKVSKEIGLYEEFVKKDKYLSLENILNEPDNSDAENEIAYTESTLHYNTTHTPSQSDSQVSTMQNGSATSDITMNDSQIQPWKPFKWVPLVKISDQLYSSDIKKTSGLISVMALSSYLAIGTTRSLIFVYDFSQNLQCILGDSNRAIEIGAVTALAFSADSNTIVCGYSQGYIIVWDIKKPDQPIRIIEPVSINQIKKKGGHIRGVSILHVGFVGTRRSEIVSADDQGMAFYHISYRMMMIGNTHSVRLLGSYQPKRPSTIFAMQHLPFSRSNHPAEHFGLVAILNPYKIVIVALKPKPQILFKFNKPKVANQQNDTKAVVESLSGCLAWLPMTNSDKENPMLAFSWGKHLFLLSVQALSNDKSRKIQLKFSEVGEWESKESIVSIQWMSRQIIVLSTPNEDMVLFDPKNMVETHYTNVQDKQVVYHDWFNAPLKNLVWDANTMTDTSAEKVLKSVEMAYFGSIKSHKGKLFLLCLDQIYVGTLLSWKDRILALLRSGNIVESISLATSFYNGVDIQTVVGLPEDEEERKELVKKNLIELLEASLKYTFAPKPVTGDVTNDVSDGNTVTIRGLAYVCIDACLSINNQELLFEIYERFLANQVAGLFLEALEPAIVEDRLSDIPPSVMKELVDHYSKKRLLDELEQIIWHIKPSSLDIDQVVGMCHREGMYEAMMHVWNTSMQDYVSPLVEMLKIIRSVLRNDSEDQQTLHARASAEKIFDYLKAILRGKSFPERSGVAISAYEAGEARSAVYSFVFSGRCIAWPPAGGKLVMTIDDDEGMLEPTYPYLRLLLRFNTRKFLECLELAFEDPWLNGGEDILSSKFDDEVPGKVISRQIIVNTLLDVFGGGLLGDTLPPPRLKPSISASTVHSFATNNRAVPLQVSTLQANAMSINDYGYFSNENIILLYIFIASNLHKYTTFILLPQKILNKVLARLSEDHDSETHREREEAAQKLLSVFLPPAHEEFVKLFEEAGFWKVLEKIYYNDKKFSKLVTAYLKDEEKRDIVFDRLKELLESDLNQKHKSDILRAFMICISQFVEIDGQKTAEFVEVFCNGSHEDAIRRLEEDQEFDDDENHTTVDKHLFSYLRGLLEPDAEFEISNVNSKLQEQYIELMCRFDPSGVFNYCNTRFRDNTSLETIRSICEKYEVMDAAVWAIDKSGKPLEALEKMLSVGEKRNECIIRFLKDHRFISWAFDEVNALKGCLISLGRILRVGTQLCENRTVDTKDGDLKDECNTDEQAEALWFRLFEAYVALSVETSNSLINITLPEIYQGITSVFKTYVQSIFTSLLSLESSRITCAQLILKLVHLRESDLDGLKEFLLDTIDEYEHKKKLLDIRVCLSNRDLFNKLKEMADRDQAGWRLQKLVCQGCNNAILDLSSSVPVIKKYQFFDCGHYFHLGCAQKSCTDCHPDLSETIETTED